MITTSSFFMPFCLHRSCHLVTFAKDRRMGAIAILRMVISSASLQSNRLIMTHYQRRMILTGLLAMMTLGLLAQRPQIFSTHIRTLQTVAEQKWTAMPIIALGSDEVVNIDFDDLTHESHRYAYRIEHCDAEWNTSTGLFESDYIDGFAEGNLIDDLQESLNTNTLYTHYHFCVPNSRCRLKLSGNYRVTVYDENEGDKLILQTCFMVAEPAVSIALQVTGNTDRGLNTHYQQVGMEVKYGSLRVSDWQREIKTRLIQNGRWDNAAVNAQAQYIRPDGLTWAHCPQFIFDGGNEYRKFEILDVNRANMGVENTGWDNHQYHAYLWPDEPRPNYVYDEDANGAFFIRNSDNREINYTAEYQMVHFRLKVPRLQGEVYLNGAWTYDQFTPDYQLTWNEEDQCYESQQLLKQGYYSYQYLLRRPDGQTARVPQEGNFFQTENSYTALVYYRQTGGRYDRLVGTCTLHTGSRRGR